jgi:hypothetical protein
VPARAERIYIVPSRNGEPCWIRPFPAWWNRSVFIQKYQHREINFENPIDANYVWVLNSAEATVWNEQSIKEFSQNPRSDMIDVIEDYHQMDSVLKKAWWLIVESYEWESGLD